MSEKRTYIAVLLDRSYSMMDTRTATISGFNEQLSAIRSAASKGGATFVSLFTFGGDANNEVDYKATKVNTVFFNESVLRLADLTEEKYVPAGFTPMYDAVGQAIEALSCMDASGDVGFLVVIISDGQENASKFWTGDKIAAKIQHLQATGKWTFAYIGANQDLSDVKQHLGLHQGNVLTYDSSMTGTSRMYRNLVLNTSSYLSSRALGVTASDNFSGASVSGE